VSIGGLLAKTELYVLDRALSPATVGLAGELHIGGDGIWPEASSIGRS